MERVKRNPTGKGTKREHTSVQVHLHTHGHMYMTAHAHKWGKEGTLTS